jgi:membrane-associated phospholipid phosphatase
MINNKIGKSFPSGHATAAWLTLIILLLFQYRSKRTQRIVLSLIIFWGCIVCGSRIVVGAHYLSDVLFASMIAILSFVSVYHYKDKYILSN